MIEMARHISMLLRFHDCVVIPGFGGILAYPVEANYDEKEQVYHAPERRIGFNVRLRHNDGLLVQSYMQAHHLTAEEAADRLQKAVAHMQQQLQTDSRVSLRGVGEFTCNIKGEIVFTPYYSYILTPSYYGLGNLSVSPLSIPGLVEFVPRSASTHRSVASFAVAAVVVLVMLFMFVLPDDIENSVDHASSYAMAAFKHEHLQNQQTRYTYEPRKVSEVKFNLNVSSESSKPASTRDNKQVEPTSLPTSSHKAVDAEVQANSAGSAVQPASAAVGESTAALSGRQSTVVASVSKSKSYYVIAASLPAMSLAEQSLSDYKAKGFQQATIVQGNGRFRIAVAWYDNRREAESRITDLRKTNLYRDVWLLIQ